MNEINLGVSKGIWEALVNEVARALHQMAVQRNAMITMLGTARGMIGLDDIQPFIRLEDNKVYMGAKYVFLSEDIAKKFYDDVLIRLGVKEIAEEKKE